MFQYFPIPEFWKTLLAALVGVLTQGKRLVFRSYLFRWKRAPVYVCVFLLWEQGNRDLHVLGRDWSGMSRLQRVWMGQRNLGQQCVEIVLTGATSDKEARTALKKGVEKMVHLL